VQRIEGILAQGAAEQSAAASTLPAGQRDQVVDVVRDAVTSGIEWAYYVGGAVLVLACVTGFVVLRHVHYEEDPEGAVAAPLG
jgi:hypothetical protein